MIKFLTEAVERAVMRTAEAVMQAAKEDCPVRTGRLKNSITLKSDGYKAEVYAAVEYAAAVELGTSRQRPQPFLSRGIAKGAEAAGKIFMEELL